MNTHASAEGYEPVSIGDNVVIPPRHGEVTVCDWLGTVYRTLNGTCDIRGCLSNASSVQLIGARKTAERRSEDIIMSMSLESLAVEGEESPM
jgi:hypothetical protein